MEVIKLHNLPQTSDIYTCSQDLLTPDGFLVGVVHVLTPVCGDAVHDIVSLEGWDWRGFVIEIWR